VNDSPEKAAHLYHPHLYKETVSANEALLNTYSHSAGADDSQRRDAGVEHRTVTHALLANPLQSAVHVTSNTGGYDLAELRKKLEMRMEYSKVTTMPHDPAMDPNQTIPSYASSSGAMDAQQQQYTGVGSTRNDLSSSEDE